MVQPRRRLAVRQSLPLQPGLRLLRRWVSLCDGALVTFPFSSFVLNSGGFSPDQRDFHPLHRSASPLRTSISAFPQATLVLRPDACADAWTLVRTLARMRNPYKHCPWTLVRTLGRFDLAMPGGREPRPSNSPISAFGIRHSAFGFATVHLGSNSRGRNSRNQPHKHWSRPSFGNHPKSVLLRPRKSPNPCKH